MANLTHLSPIRDHLGRPLKDLRISVMDRCNFRCIYCMPEEKFHSGFNFLKSSERLSFDEILRVTKLFTDLGVSKIRITGGEPLLRVNLTELIGDLSTLKKIEDIALTTNGVLLKKYSEELKACGLNRITVSLDSIDPEQFRKMSGGRGNLETVLEGIDAALSVGFKKLKINAVIKRGTNDDQVIEMIDYFKDQSVIIRFIEYMDVGNLNQWKLNETVGSDEIIKKLSEKWQLDPLDKNYEGETAQRYQIDGSETEIGLISSVTKPFCGSCTRARLSSDGKLYNCLFASEGKDIRSWVRDGKSDEYIKNELASIWKERRDRYSELRYSGEINNTDEKVEMYYIGG
ncbi:MAG: cyclic pyranopterin monophosphate synthase [Pseudomonadota bacterium]|nr:GTP 3',8-cyclase MoaA [Pseudomonadota bacterium]GIS40976.1 MAG: cyclic pyranopterin monophosphate synthase [Pseudomonadota bacterium]